MSNTCNGDGLGTNARFGFPYGIVISQTTGVTYVADSGGRWGSNVYATNTIRIIRMDGQVTTLAGSLYAPGGAWQSFPINFHDGVGTNALFYTPLGIVVDDEAQTVIVADNNFHAIRSISLTTALVTTVAGQGVFGNGYEGGIFMTFTSPVAMATGVDGNLYVTDSTTIRVLSDTICPAGYYCTAYKTVLPCPAGSYCPISSALPTPCPAGVYSPRAMAKSFSDCLTPCPPGSVCSAGSAWPTACPDGTWSNLFNATSAAHCLPCAAAPGWACSDGATSAAGTICPAGSACTGGSAEPTFCSCSTLCPAGSTSEPVAAVVWNIATLAGSGAASTVDGFGTNAAFNGIQALTWDYSTDSMVVIDAGSKNVRRVTAAGNVSFMFGITSTTTNWRDGPATSAIFYSPQDVVVVPTGAVIISDYVTSNMGGRIRYFYGGSVTTLIGARMHGTEAVGLGAFAMPRTPISLARNAYSGIGDVLYFLDYSSNDIFSFTPSGNTTKIGNLGRSAYTMSLSRTGILYSYVSTFCCLSQIYATNISKGSSTVFAGAGGNYGWGDGPVSTALFVRFKPTPRPQ